MKNLLFIIDPQVDFMSFLDGRLPELEGAKPALPVAGACEDMNRLSQYIEERFAEIDEIVVTLDTHELPGSIPDIGHPSFWTNGRGAPPEPFTPITLKDVEGRVWTPRDHSLMPQVKAYLEKVGTQVVWRRHCVDGTPGHRVYSRLRLALDFWERQTGRKVTYVRKGMNPLTEQYGVFEAAVPNPYDPSTQFNEKLLQQVAEASQVVVAGEALDFCVKTSIEQAAAKLPPEALTRFTLLVDCMSPVNLDGKNTVGKKFLADMCKLGMHTAKSTDKAKLAA